ncbi:toll-like receptor 4 [Mercenaria mercenaria]|uniref:toll-like receptor 4 n=1 Tax=Mercenaria mercenaria TaxID=6596 RepID=UPI00234E7CE4|nr:toll-like receptor 4 [Mercenaria mercenaria]
MTMFVYTPVLTTLLMVQLAVSQHNQGITVPDMTQYHGNMFNGHTAQPNKENSYPCPNNPNCSCSEFIKLKELKVDCTSTKMTEIPANFPNNTTTLILAKNYISEIPDGIFNWYSFMTSLDLSYNYIAELGSDTFTGLENLRVLNLQMNKLRYTHTAIRNDTFRPLKQLTTLYLHQNLSEFWENESYPIQAMKLLTNLTKLNLDGMKNQSFVSEFKALALETLNLGGRFRGEIGQITKNMFHNLPTLKRLYLKNCSIDFVENGSFTELSNLEKLDLSFNEYLEFKSLANITYGLQFTQIKSLNLRRIHEILGDCTKLTEENLKYISNTSVKNISLDSNRLETMDPKAVQYIPKSLERVSVRYNRLAFGKYIWELSSYVRRNDSANLKYLSLASQRLPDRISQGLKQFYLGKQYSIIRNNNKRSLDNLKRPNIHKTKSATLSHDSINGKGSNHESKENHSVYNYDVNDESDMFLQYFSSRCGYCPMSSIRIVIPRNLEYLDLHEMRFRTELLQFCMCENKIETLRCDKNMIWNWKGKLLGLNRLKNLTLANNACSRISYDFFDNMTSLVSLNISKNFLGTPLSKDYNGQTFKKLANLETLSLAYNGIKQLPINFFRGLTRLRNLTLKGNQIAHVDWNTQYMENLSFVDLADNFIEVINESVRKNWDKLASKTNLSVNLAKNNLQCTCQHLDLIKWFSETRVHFMDYKTYTCKFDNGSVGNLTFVSQIYRSLESECANYLTIILATSAAILIGIFAIVAGTVYRYRWNLRYMYYSAKVKLRGYVPVNNDDSEFEHDAFVSYASEDGTFVRQHLVPELEMKRGLKLLVHDRDFVAGNFVCDNIMRAITTSNKMLIIMTPHFLRSRWCCYEMNMARMEAIKTGRDVICILMKEHVRTSGLPLEVLDIIQQQTYMDYPTGNHQHVQQFWERVADTLRQK